MLLNPYWMRPHRDHNDDHKKRQQGTVQFWLYAMWRCWRLFTDRRCSHSSIGNYICATGSRNGIDSQVKAGSVQVTRLRSQHPGPNAGIASARAFKLGTTPLDLLLSGLWGCTSLVVMSEKDIWMSHFWEAPNIRADRFDADVMAAMRSGTASVPSLTALVNQGAFSPDSKPRIVLYTDWDSGLGPGAFACPDQIDAISTYLTTELHLPAPDVVGYSPDYANEGSATYDLTNTRGKILF
ncbi:uncharacterized protein PAC_17654 [Phialocephala subalpina]|uniref:Uncharacterized protein n=1 Tax=Phialocephala subalpina TaxID=576137 RepID=A0A1L7XRY3_9HELO|nr:uncharacterized protein PAC_17654 [Phialocephala subalpina]